MPSPSLNDIVKAEAEMDRMIEGFVDNTNAMKNEAPGLYVMLNMIGGTLNIDQIRKLIADGIKKDQKQFVEIVCGYAKLGLMIVELHAAKKEKEEEETKS